MITRVLVFAIACFTLSLSLSAQESRIKDLANIKGMRSNGLIGLGLVVGLPGTGDTPGSLTTNIANRNFLSRLGLPINPQTISTQSVALVTLTAELPPFSRNGDKIDIKAAVIGDAVDLSGGVLIKSFLKAGDGQSYVVAQGTITMGQASGTGAQTRTSAWIPGGGTVEREFVPNIIRQGMIILSLKHPDLTTNYRITNEINQHFRSFIASASDPAAIRVRLPKSSQNDPIRFLSELESLTVPVDTRAVVVINEKTGTVIMGNDVKISPLAISHGNLSITIEEENTTKTSRIGPLSGTTIKDLIESLNSLGVTSKDLISIIQSIHQAGALQAELKII